jgi:pilus assembly protein FimV
LIQHRFSVLLGFFLLVISGAASAIGLGELGGSAILGSRLALTVDLLGAEKVLPEAACFKVVRPRGSDDLPWLQQASFAVRSGNQPVLEVRTTQVLREPIVQLAIQLSCGHEVYREYTLLASPPSGGSQFTVSVEPVLQKTKRESEGAALRRATPVSGDARSLPKLPPKLPVAIPAAEERLSDRLLLSAGDTKTESSLRLSTVLGQGFVAGEALGEAQREILRLEFRILMALHEQASGQLSAAERLRHAEAALDDLQGKAVKLTDRASANLGEKAGALPVAEPDSVGASKKLQSAQPAVEGFFSGWVFYGMLIGVFLGLGTWLFWRNYREYEFRKAQDQEASDFFAPVPDAPLNDKHEEGAELDLSLEPVTPGVSVKMDVVLDGEGDAMREHVKPLASSAQLVEATVDEHFEANPVMELADIMLSFGRVKGAAQALQEYVDNNPQEALQPWMRLMDVYRMAGMRDEFAKVAADLNKYFNVEVQSWDMVGDGASVDLVLDSGEGASDQGQSAPKVRGLEDMPRIISSIVRMWDSEDVVGYMYELLRDNRGGQRQGFSAFVASEILFLIELKETANRMNRELEKRGAPPVLPA